MLEFLDEEENVSLAIVRMFERIVARQERIIADQQFLFNALFSMAFVMFVVMVILTIYYWRK